MLAVTGLKYSCFLSSYPELNISYRIKKEAKLNKASFFSQYGNTNVYLEIPRSTGKGLKRNEEKI